VRTFQRWTTARFEGSRADGLSDRRLGRPSPRRAPQEELERKLGLYRDKYADFTVKHFHEQLQKRHGYVLGYTVTKLALHAAGLVRPAPKRSAHRKKRPRRGMLLHQDGSRHAWLEGQPALDLIVTMDDATSEVLSLFLVAEEGTASTFAGLREVVAEYGVFCALYTDRGSHCFERPKAGAKVSKTVLTQVGRALQQLGIEHIAAYSPEARGRSERLLRTLQDRLPKELRLAGITTIAAANAWLEDHYKAEHNRQFAIAPEEEGTAFVPDREGTWRDILCVIEERVVGNDNTVAWNGRRLQLPESRLRPHFVRAKVQVRAYPNGEVAIDLGPHRLARYGADRREVPAASRVAACSKASRDGLPALEREAGASQRPPLTPSARAAKGLPCRKASKGPSKGRALKHKAERKRAA
jgi:hypothetical protein